MPVSIIIGFIFGLSSAFFFAFYMVPQKWHKVDTTTFLFLMTLGVLLSSLIVYAAMGFQRHSTLADKGDALLCGAVWGLGTLAFTGGIRRIGLALSTPIKNTTGIFGTLVGLVLFEEWKTTDPWRCLAGSALIVIAAIIIGTTGNRDTTRRANVTGVGLSLVAALCYASYLYPMKLAVSHIGYWEFTPWMAIGMLFTALVAILLRPGGVREAFGYPPRVYAFSLLGGVSWTLAFFSLAASMMHVDLSIAWSLAQLNTVPAVFMGMFVFHEVSWAKKWRAVLLGLLVAIIGTVLLGMAK